MPIHLIWGDDEAARSRAVEALVNSQVDPSWQSINLSRLDGNDANQAAQALEEARTAPFGAGDRVIVLQRSPFCNQCPADLAEQLEATLNLVAEQCHLVLVNAAKPDGRLKTTKALQKLVKSGEAKERSFQLPAVWDGSGQVDLVQRTAQELGLKLQPDAAQALSDAIGSDSARLASELEKLSLYVGAGQAITAQGEPLVVRVCRKLEVRAAALQCFDPSSRAPAPLRGMAEALRRRRRRPHYRPVDAQGWLVAVFSWLGVAPPHCPRFSRVREARSTPLSEG